MAVNKIIYGNQTLIDLTDTTATAADVAEGKYFYGADGTKIVGTASFDGGIYQDEDGFLVLDPEGGGGGSSDGAVGVVDTIDESGGTIREITAISLKNDTVSPSTLAYGVTAHNSAGQAIVGTMEDLAIEPEDTSVWERPLGWPDLDALLDTEQEDTDVAYITLDNTDAHGLFHLGVTTVSGTAIFEYGHVANGIFVADHSETATSNTKVTWFAKNDWGNYPIVRITAANGFSGLSNDSYIPIDGVATAKRPDLATRTFLEAVVRCGRKCTIGASLRSYRLQRVYLDCTSIHNIDLRDCYALREANTGDWVLSDTMTSLSYAFSNCERLPRINCEDWDVSNITNFSRTFIGCKNLVSLDLSKWQMSKAQNYYAMFEDCRVLKELKLSADFVQSSVSSIDLGDLFFNCYSLPRVNCKDWDTSAVFSYYRMFSGCRSIQELDFENWDSSIVTDMRGMFEGCRLLKTLKHADKLNSNVVKHNYYGAFFNGCDSLSKWPTGLVLNYINYTASAIDYALNANFTELNVKSCAINVGNLKGPPLFNNCYRLRRLDLSGWDTSAWTGCHIYFTFPPYEYLNLNGWDFSHLASFSLKNSSTVKEYWPPVVAINHSYNNMINLDHASKLRILNVLPEVETTKTLTLGRVAGTLSDEEIAIATEKGWTIA